MNVDVMNVDVIDNSRKRKNGTACILCLAMPIVSGYLLV
jgi:hypothetical protein